MAILLRNFLYFLKRKLFLYFGKWNFLIFQKTETPKKFLIFQETELFHKSENGNPEKISYISGNRNPEKLLIFQEVTFWARKIKKKSPLKKLLIFGKMELSSSKLKKLLWFRNLQDLKIKNFLYFSKKVPLHFGITVDLVCWENFLKTNAK